MATGDQKPVVTPDSKPALSEAIALAGYELLTAHRAVTDTTKPGDVWRTCEPGEIIALTVRQIPQDQLTYNNGP